MAISSQFGSRLQELSRGTLDYIKVFLRSLPLLWQAAPREALFLSILLLLQGVLPGISIWINKQVVDTVAQKLGAEADTGFWSVPLLAIAWLVAVFLQTLVSPWESAASSNLGEKLTARVNLKLMRKANSFGDLARFEDANFYDELQLIQEQAGQEPYNLLSIIVRSSRGIFTTITAIILLAPIGWWLPIVILLANFPQTYISFTLRRKIWRTLSRKSPQSRRMQYFSEILLTDTYAKEVRLFGLGALFIDRYYHAFQDKYSALRRLRDRQAMFSSALTILSAGGNAFAFYWVIRQAIAANITLGGVLLFIQSLSLMQQSLTQLINSSLVLQRTLLFMERFFGFLDSQPTMGLLIPGKAVPSPLKTGITFDRVNFFYPDGRLALDEISLAIAPGETIALVGENGAGKTTLIKLLARFYDPTQGNIWIDNLNLKDLDLVEWRQQIAVIHQDFCRYALTLSENIALGDTEAIAHEERLERAAQAAGIARKTQKLERGYQTLVGKQFGGTELSGGEWQKVALARAFFRQENAQILVLDEPTAALDPRSEYEIYTRFAELVRGKTAILVTHRLASVRMADRIIVLKGGRQIEQGTHQELLRYGGEYATLWNMQAQQYKHS